MGGRLNLALAFPVVGAGVLLLFLLRRRGSSSSPAPLGPGPAGGALARQGPLSPSSWALTGNARPGSAPMPHLWSLGTGELVVVAGTSSSDADLQNLGSLGYPVIAGG